MNTPPNHCIPLILLLMCGIFGIITKPGKDFPQGSIKNNLKSIAKFSESRGKDSSGMAFRNISKEIIDVIKGDIPIRDLLKSEAFSISFQDALESQKGSNGFAAFGHARLVTNGSQLQEVNNQPVVKDDILCIHNGIITNVDEIWKENPILKREFLIDTEIIPALLRKNLKEGNSLSATLYNSLSVIEGTYSIANMFADLDQFVLATNNGSLYYITDNVSYIVFASEGYFLEKLTSEKSFASFQNKEIYQLQSNTGLIINLFNLEIEEVQLSEMPGNIPVKNRESDLTIQKHLLENKDAKYEVVIDPSVYINRDKEKHLLDLLENNEEQIDKLKRCTKCLLPETFPFIEFDPAGVCNLCNNYTLKNQPKPLDELKAMVEPYRRKDNKPDCIVPFSGGRDSTYTLHIVKEILGLNPIAYTYDWGMVTDLARRNIARVCGKLGVENIIVSADIRWKRENIRKNIQAWLKYPSLGMIPLFMAGDKYFFYYCDKVKKQTDIDLNIWGINYLENTEFKTGFAGLPPKLDKKRIYSLSLKNQVKLFGFVVKNVLISPGYINQSVLDSLGSFATRYIAPKKDYYHMFDYYRWDEDEINDLIQNEYKWETAIDTESTWRIGDGTASFYNYIYYTVAGFSENDTFRSNQIREGMLDRDTALKLVKEDNKPRYETLRWYLEIVGLDFTEVIKVINRIPKLY